MQEALPYKRWEVLPPVLVASTSSNSGGNVGSNNINNSNTMESLVKKNPVIVFGKRGCCMCHVVRKLLLGLGVNPPVFEIDSSNANESLLINSLSKFVVNNNGGKNNNSVNTLQFPLVFVGGELFGGLEKVMATHLSGELVPILKQAGALWL
ncbi:glutaredoxin-C9-like [Chenopodium quinoa]|uniref:glutaredoxin-C9-like n=1 Tax=Chenopodium quinoa TaxID=63459 RepID=UPI000B775567|nr:glutaredoxin-C9-like [Chenopodium quinoa]